MLRFVFVTAFALCVLAGQASAQGVLRIAAIVNDEVISLQDLSERVQLVMVSSDLPDRPEVAKRVAPQILRTLIDERIKRQEADRAGVAVEQREIDDALGDIERQNRVPAGQLDSFLAQKGLPKGALVDKLRSDISWSKFVSRKLRPQVRVSEEEIDDMLARIRASKGSAELRVAEIFLPVEDTKRKEEVRALAERLIDQARGGADFGTIAENFSQSPSAGAGGDLGWLTKGQIEDPVFEALKNLQPNSIAGPVESPTGMAIYLLRGKRVAEGIDGPGKVMVGLTQMVMPVAKAGPGGTDEAIRKLTALAGKANDCPSFRAAAKETGTPLSGDVGTVALASLPSEIQSAVQGLRANGKSKPTITRDGPTIYMVCSREGDDAGDPRQKVRSTLVREKLDLISRRQIRDLRRDAFIDVRI